MQKISVKKIILTAMFIALTFAATMVIRIPTGNGYVNLGDCVVLMSGFLLGPYYGALAAGIGSALADLIGYPIYAPATFIIKAIVALLAGLIFKISKKRSTVWVVVCGIIGEAFMVLGYYVVEAFILGLGWEVAMVSVPSNIFQGIAGIATSSILIQIFMQRNNSKSRQNDDEYDEDNENE